MKHPCVPLSVGTKRSLRVKAGVSVYPKGAGPNRSSNESVCVCVLFGAQQLQLVLVLREQPLESQVFSDDG